MVDLLMGVVLMSDVTVIEKPPKIARKRQPSLGGVAEVALPCWQRGLTLRWTLV